MFLQQSAAEQRRLLETVIEKATWKDGQLQTALGGEGMIAYASNISSASTVSSPRARVAAYGWQALAGELDNYGCAVLPKLLSPEECRAIAALYSDESHFRSQVQMARHGFGKGEYRYFKYPLPGLLGYLRTALYPQLASVAS